MMPESINTSSENDQTAPDASLLTDDHLSNI
jgi:predicted lipid-binding transport protein (Tim44 family)